MPSRPAFALDRSFTHRLHTLTKLTDRATQAAYLEQAGIALGEGRCLSAVASFGPLGVNELAAWANLNKGQASRAAQSLVEQGLVSKQPGGHDARAVTLTLTPEGARVWARLQAVIAKRNEQILSCLDAEERRTLDGLLDRLLNHARSMASQVPSDD